MTLVGTRLAHYEIVAPLGRGGMGEVWRARDAKLGREVAIKTLPPELASDTDRLARFEREARLLASLNHPNIASIYGLEESERTRFLVLELIDGDTLADRIARGPIPMDEAIRLALQIAEALEAAHDKSVVHRDLKPANVKVTRSGRVKVLDFGLAKGIAAADSSPVRATEAETLAMDATRAGTILGTPSYMSPEQARGYATDGRTDIWSFGCVLYEMLTGRQTFAGPTAVDVIGALIGSNPNWDLLPGSTPPQVSDLLRRCLEKDAARRCTSFAYVRAGLESAASTPQATASPRYPFEAHASTLPPIEKSLLVLPFQNQSPDPEDEYFSDGLTEELITDLSRVRELRVVPSAATFRLKKTYRALSDLAGEFKVRYALTGRVRKAASSVRINAELIDLWSDRSIWADRYTGELADAFALQEQVSRSIAGALELQLESPRHEPRPEAREAYLRGRHFFRQATSTGLQRAMECYEEAGRIDPLYGPAFAALAEALVAITMAWEALPARETMPKARAAAQRALDLDPRLAEAQVGLGMVATFFEWDREQAERFFEEALRLNSSCIEAYRWYAACLMWLDTRYAEAIQVIDRGLANDPTDPWLKVYRSFVYYYRRDFDHALEEARRTTAQEPFFAYGHFVLGCTLAMLGRPPEAIASFERGIELDERNMQMVGQLGLGYALDGQDGRARQCLEELESYERAGRDVAIWKMTVYTGWGDREGVLRCLEQAIELRSSAIFALVNPYTDFVADDPRFHALLRRAGLEYLKDRRPEPRWTPPRYRPQ